MRHAHLGLAIVLGLAACKKNPPPTMEALEKIKAECAACENKGCAEKIDKRMSSMLDGIAESDLDEARIDIAFDVGICVAKWGIE